MSYKFLSTILGIDANFTGLVGIGTTSPSTLLQVKGNGNNMISVQYASDGGAAGYGFYNSAGVELWSIGGGRFVAQDAFEISRQGSLKFLINSDGNVGIGTSSGFNAISGVETTLQIANNNAASLYLNCTSANKFALYSSVTGSLQVYNITQNNYPFGVTSAGNVVIGITTDSGFKLDVNGTTRFQGNSLVSLNQNAATSLTVSNTTSGTSSESIIRATSSSGSMQIGKFSATTTTYKSIVANDGYIYNNSSGNISVLNDFSTGNINFTARGASTAQVIMNGSSQPLALVGGGSSNFSMNSGNDVYFYFNSQSAVGRFYANPQGTVQNTFDQPTSVGFVGVLAGASVWYGNMNSSGGSVKYNASINGVSHSHIWYHNFSEQMRLAYTGNLLIGTSTDAGFKLDVNGTSMIRGVAQYNSDVVLNGNRLYIGSHLGNTVLRPISTTNLQLFNSNAGATLFLDANGAVQIGQSNAVTWAYFTASGSTLYNTTTLPSLAGTGTRMVVADATGILSTQAVPTGTVTGSGTTNYISKWTSSSALGNSLVYDNGTNVGIGTTSPSYKLDVNGSLYWGNPSGEYMYAGGGGHKFAYSNSTGNWLYSGGTSGLTINNAADTVNLLRITDSGNVLIGTTSDNGEKLQVNGNATIGSSGGSNSITINGGPNGTASYYGSGVGNGSWDSRPNGNAPYINQWHTGLTFSANSYYGGIRFYNQGYPNVYSSTLVMSVTNDAVGIGTTSPSSKLHVDNPGYSFIAGYDAGNRRVYVGLDSSGEPSIQSALSNGAPRQLDINPLGGNVGIGTTTPTEKLSVNGNMAFPKSGNTFIYNDQSGADSITIGGASYFSVKTFNGANYTEVFRATATNNLLIGTTTDNGYRLQVSGRASIYTGATVTDSVAFSVADGSNGLNYIPYVGTGSYNNLSYGGGSLLFNNISSRLTVGTHNGTAIQFGPSDTLISGAITLFSLGGSGTRMVVANASGVLSTQAIPGGGAIKAYGSWQSNNTQLSPANNFPTPVIYDVVNFNNNISVDLDFASQYTLITMLVDGVFNIQFSFQFRNLSSSDQDVYVWFRKNGQTQSDDIANSNTLISVPAKHGSGTPGHTVAAWNFFVQATANDYYQIVWATSDKNNVSMEYIPPTPFGPGSPSSILTVNKVD